MSDDRWMQNYAYGCGAVLRLLGCGVVAAIGLVLLALVVRWLIGVLP